MSPISILAITCALLLQVQPASPPAADPCAHPATRTAEEECAWIGYQTADAELNRLYQEISSSLPSDEAKARLRALERSWVEYRDRTAEFMAYAREGGSGQYGFYATCLRSLTEAHTRELRWVAEGYGSTAGEASPSSAPPSE